MRAAAHHIALALIVFAPLAAAAQPRIGVHAALDAAEAQSAAVANVLGRPAELAARLDLAERRLAAERDEGLQAVLDQLEIASGAVYRVLRGVGPRLTTDPRVVRAAR